jgi:leucyl aminopeptidase (aminopeptidase T)
MRRFLQLALDLVDDLVFHLLDRGARPDGLHDHDAEGEIRVFLLAHAHQAEHAGDDDQAEQEARDARMADRPARQVEGLLLFRGIGHRSRSLRLIAARDIGEAWRSCLAPGRGLLIAVGRETLTLSVFGHELRAGGNDEPVVCLSARP